MSNVAHQQAPRPLRHLADDPEIDPVESLAGRQQVPGVRVSVDEAFPEDLPQRAGDGGVDGLFDVDARGLELAPRRRQLDASLDPGGGENAAPRRLPVHARDADSRDVAVEPAKPLRLLALGDKVELGKHLRGELVDERGEGLGGEGPCEEGGGAAAGDALEEGRGLSFVCLVLF